MFNHTTQKGVSLFEMLLVMVMSGMVASAAFKYQQVQAEKNVADVFARQMFIYSQAVRAYALDHQADITAGTFQPSPDVAEPSTFTKIDTKPTPTYTFTGVSWMTGLTRPNEKPYVANPVSFENLHPLTLQSLDGKLKGDAVVTATIIGSQITINYGMLYSQGSDRQMHAMPAIASIAAGKASGMFDPVLGPSAFTYSGGIDAARKLQPIVATLGGLYATGNFVQPNLPTEGNLIFSTDQTAPQLLEPSSSDQGTEESAPESSGTEELEGQIENVHGIQFNRAGPLNTIVGVNFLNFGIKKGADSESTESTFTEPTEPTEVIPLTSDVGSRRAPTPGNATGVTTGATTGAETGTATAGATSGPPPTPDITPVTGTLNNPYAVNFAPNSVINHLGTLNMAPNGQLNMLNALNFAPGGTQNTIDDVSKVVFQSNGTAFGGIGVRSIQSLYGLLNGGGYATTDDTSVFARSHFGAVLALPGAALFSTAGPQSITLVHNGQGKIANTASHFCGLSTVQFQAADLNIGQACQVYADTAGNYQVVVQQMLSCSVICFEHSVPAGPSIGTPCFFINGVGVCR